MFALAVAVTSCAIGGPAPDSDSVNQPLAVDTPSIVARVPQRVVTMSQSDTPPILGTLIPLASTTRPVAVSIPLASTTPPLADLIPNATVSGGGREWGRIIETIVTPIPAP
ncbi:MAG: hypothetical protein QF898_13610 [SAR202 cluster bacterium]|nr:hypothetical protein [SAR202 cluster bacterium]MDP6511914.1 hypothetical protein [SAR202 cluster bacterium]MDP6715353.1 hypothetical protein [SAR202 cluster bacterium]